MSISKEQKSQLELVARTGFAFMTMLEAMPDEISILYSPYFKRRGARKNTKRIVAKFSSVTLAIAKGHSAEDREKYLAKKKAGAK